MRLWPAFAVEMVQKDTHRPVETSSHISVALPERGRGDCYFRHRRCGTRGTTRARRHSWGMTTRLRCRPSNPFTGSSGWEVQQDVSVARTPVVTFGFILKNLPRFIPAPVVNILSSGMPASLLQHPPRAVELNLFVNR